MYTTATRVVSNKIETTKQTNKTFIDSIIEDADNIMKASWEQRKYIWEFTWYRMEIILARMFWLWDESLNKIKNDYVF